MKSGQKGFSCDICKRRLRSRYNLKVHLAVHSGEKDFVCKVCNKGFQQKWNLVTHTARVHLKEKPFKCQDCGKAFGYSSHFKTHVLKKHFLEKVEAPDAVKKKILKPVKCDFCPRVFENNYRLYLHQQNRHKNVVPFPCTKCRTAFTTRRLLVIHQAQKHFLFSCQECGERFSNAEDIARHYDKDHRELESAATPESKRTTSDDRRRELLACEICGKRVTRETMRKHQNVHTRQRLYQCRFCSKQFLENSQRKVHERVHTGEKPYLCDVCGKAHTQYGNLLTHRKKHHNLTTKLPGVRPRRHSGKPREVPSEPLRPCTGDETIEEFRKIAKDWFQERFRDCKSRDEVPSDTESEDNIPLAAFRRSQAGEDVVEPSGSESDDDEVAMNEEEYPAMEARVVIKEEPGGSPVPTPEPEDVPLVQVKTEVLEMTLRESARAARERMYWLIFDRMAEEESMKGLWTQRQVAEVRDAGLQGSCRDVLKLLLFRLGSDLPDTAVLARDGAGSETWTCWTCPAAFTTRCLLARHLLIHQPPDTWPFRCPTCSKTFTQSNNYKEHVMTHTHQSLYCCETCGRGFRHKTHFNRHVEKHEAVGKEKRPRKHTCEYCGKAFDTAFHLKEHERTHTKEKPYLCKTCGGQFATYSTFSRHQRTHSDTRPHKCPVCHKHFKVRFCLKRHMDTHIGCKRFSCVCGKLFGQKGSLKKHQYTCHTNEEPPSKPHVCLLCSKRFLSRSDLKRHMATHDPTKLHTCQLCNTKLKTWTTYKKHMVRHQLDCGPMAAAEGQSSGEDETSADQPDRTR